MNTETRKQISALISQVESLENEIEQIKDEQQDILDNMPEGFRNGEKGEQQESCISALDTALASIQDVHVQLEEAAQ